MRLRDRHGDDHIPGSITHNDGDFLRSDGLAAVSNKKMFTIDGTEANLTLKSWSPNGDLQNESEHACQGFEHANFICSASGTNYSLACCCGHQIEHNVKRVEIFNLDTHKQLGTVVVDKDVVPDCCILEKKMKRHLLP